MKIKQSQLSRWALLYSFLCSFCLTTSAFAGFEPMMDEKSLDRSVDPCADFYSFACGGWVASTQLPGDQSGWYRSFSTINEQNLVELRQILESYAKGDYSLESHYSKKLGDYYSACMDEAALEKSYASVAEKELHEIHTVGKSKSLSREVGELLAKGFPVFFRFGSTPDVKNSSQTIAYLDQGGLGLPNRDYYFEKNKEETRAKYRAHVARTLRLSGIQYKDSKRYAKRILEIETELAKNSLSPEQRRDPKSLYHMVSIEQLSKWAPELSWKDIFSAAGAPEFEQLNVAVPDFFIGLNSLLTKLSLTDLRMYLHWHMLRASAEDLGKELATEHFNFYGKTLSGQKEQKARWKYCVESADSSFEDGLGEAFVKKTFGEKGKASALAMVKNIQEAFRSNLATVDWMDESTKKAAVEKLESIRNKIGYPDVWTDLSKLEISRDSHAVNSFEINRFWAAKKLQEIGQPVNRAKWEMTPPTVNAYYSPDQNEIAFPAGILQSPFYHQDSTLAANYGAIGLVIGHELTHGFDDEGRQYDPQGNLKDWWSPQVSQVFSSKAKCLVEQYSGYTVSGDIHLKGDLTLGENIADLGGVKLAYAALKLARDKDAPETVVSGFTEDQQFFVSFAQSWCAKVTPEREKLLASNDPHSPPKYRVNGVLVNTPEFAKAFSCKEGSPMAPVNRCSIW